MSTFGLADGWLLARAKEEMRALWCAWCWRSMMGMISPEMRRAPSCRKMVCSIASARGLCSTRCRGSAAGAVSFRPPGRQIANAVQEVAAKETRWASRSDGREGCTARARVRRFFRRRSVWQHLEPGADRPMAAIGTEARAVGNHELFAPVLDLGREPRWGARETYGKTLPGSRLGVAMSRACRQRLSDPDTCAWVQALWRHGEPLAGATATWRDHRARPARDPSQDLPGGVQEAGRGNHGCYHALDSIPAMPTTGC